MNRYYSESKFFLWLRKKLCVDKPEALPWDEWETYHAAAKVNKPFAYWVTETLPDLLEKPAELLIDPLYEVKYYLRNRFISSHMLKTGLPKGKFHEYDTKLLHGVFNELVDFIEIEKAHMQVWCGGKDNKKYSNPFWHKFWPLRWIEWRCAEAGIDHLNLEIGLVYNTDCGIEESDPLLGKLTPQAESAIWLLSAYKWWTIERPSRVDPYDKSGITAFSKRLTEKYGDGMWQFNSKITQEEKEEQHALYELVNEIEKQYFDEDTKWLKEVIDHRSELWT